jgi:murein DD-endopeptidase MepM/ murein hydrolase activator NlpD
MAAKKKINVLLIFFYSVVLALLLFSLLKDDARNSSPEKIKTPPEVTLNQFGFEDDSLIVQQANIKLNQTLSSIFAQFNLTGDIITKLLSISKDHFNYHKIIAGNNYYAFMSNDSINTLRYFVYEEDPINYVVFNLDDSLKIYTGQKQVTTENKTISAVINHSLYTALQNNEASPELVIKLSEVFAWQVDFYRIQRGDYFKVIYEEDFVDNESIGIKKITGAYFNHSGEEFYAIGFKQDGISQFFDEEGKSLRKAFLKAPIEYSRISSRYTSRRLHPVQKVYKAHLGTDYAALTGTPIRSVGDGVVIESSYTRGNGRYIKIKHNSVYTTQYLHMSRFAKGMRPGVWVKQGQVIGYVGSTGLATGPHLCYRFWKNGVQIDPLREKIPPSHPVKPELLKDYNKKKVDVLTELDNMKLSFENQPELSSIGN